MCSDTVVCGDMDGSRYKCRSDYGSGAVHGESCVLTRV